VSISLISSRFQCDRENPNGMSMGSNTMKSSYINIYIYRVIMM